MSLEPLGWTVGIMLGAAIAAFLGGYLPSWGVALAPAAAILVCAIGTHRVPEDDTLAWVLRVTVALTIGFVATTAPLTLFRLDQSPEAAAEAGEILFMRELAGVKSILAVRWAVMASMTPVGAIALFLRRRQLRAG